MDVDTDRQSLADHDRDHHLMDTTLDGAQTHLDKGKAPESRPGDDEPPATNEAAAVTEPTQVLERPREGEGDGAQEPAIQTCKTPR